MKRNSIKKVTLDMYIEQMKWSVWFIGILMAVYIGLNIASSLYNFSFVENLLAFSAGSSIIYMFVIGIIAGATFLPQFLKLGVTRTHWFYGTVASAMLISVTLPLIFSMFAGIEYMLSLLFNLRVDVSLLNNYFPSFLLYSLNIFVSYLAGWLINVGYYKFNWIIGFIFIALSVGLNAVYALIWGSSIITLYSVKIDLFDNNLEAAVPTGSSFLMSALGTLGVVLVTLFIIRSLTKKISIKIK